ncbi:hypothetical protein ABFA25_06735 [Mycobacterium lepromatosis]|uniref:hypothetical protein n=1 Tax=Mycobacterium lepromatosis TaxID=480418 RepID=UPI003D80718D
MRVPEPKVGKLGSALNRMLDHIMAAPGHSKRAKPQLHQFVANASDELDKPLGATIPNLISTTDGPGWSGPGGGCTYDDMGGIGDQVDNAPRQGPTDFLGPGLSTPVAR